MSQESVSPVWVSYRTLSRRGENHNNPTAKLAPQHYDPFPIAKKLSPITYHMTLPLSMKIHPIFYMDLLTQYHKTEAHGPNYEQPTPDIIDGEPEWEVEKIIKS